MSELHFLPRVDSSELADLRRTELNISRDMALYQSRIVVNAMQAGYYSNERGDDVDWRQQVVDACLAKKSIPPWQDLPSATPAEFEVTTVQVSNESTVGALLRLIDKDARPLALNFANGVSPGGDFLGGARAQEEAICRASSLYWTLIGDPMYLFHSYREQPDSTAWAILSPQVPIFRADNGVTFDTPRLADFITCAAPYAPVVGQPLSGTLLRDWIHRVLAIAQAYRYKALVLGAWGCGAFGNDTLQTANDFRKAIEGPFAGGFSDIVFAITDWSPERRFLGPFRNVFSEELANA